MDATFNEQKLNRWKPLLEHEDLPKIEDPYKRNVTAVLLENQFNDLSEAAPTNAMGASSSTPGDGAIDTFDPVLISLVRRSAPNLIAFDVVGVQPMNQPVGLVFAMRSRYRDQANAEALFNEANTGFSAENSGNTFNFAAQQAGDDASVSANSTNYTAVTGMTTAQAEALGDGTSGNEFNEMAFSIEQISVTAKSRALKAEYTLELAQDLRSVHGLDAEAELANILATEITAEINREVIRQINITATEGSQRNVSSAGTFNLDADANGRWSVERFKGLLFHLDREANLIAQATRRGRGNILLCSPDIASALDMTGLLDANPALAAQANLNTDFSANTFAGTLLGRIKVYVDPYFSQTSASQYFTLGYKGTSPFDAGIFYCPYVPLTMVRAVGENTFQPKIGFKTRYGMVANPFATTDADGALSVSKKNIYYRKSAVTNIM